MSAPGLPDRIIPPTQVWSALTTDLGTSVVWLLAHLAVTVVATTPTTPLPKEVSHADPPTQPENPA